MEEICGILAGELTATAKVDGTLSSDASPIGDLGYDGACPSPSDLFHPSSRNQLKSQYSAVNSRGRSHQKGSSHKELSASAERQRLKEQCCGKDHKASRHAGPQPEQ